uniref:Uncharacterized protein n=1 Tax=Trichogramma kaykai TaxID=54128 RepID=A0ABD2VV61_9HYME
MFFTHSLYLLTLLLTRDSFHELQKAKARDREREREREKGRKKRAHTYERAARRSVYSSESPRDKSRKGGIEDRGQYNVALPGIRALGLLLLLLLLLLLAVVAAAATNCSGRCARAGDLCDATAIYPPYKVACASELTQISAHIYIIRQEDTSAQHGSSCIAPISYFINYIMMHLYILHKLIVLARWSAAQNSNDFDAAKWKRKSICIRVFAPEFIFQLCRAILDTVGIPTWYTRKKRKKDTQSRRQSQGGENNEGKAHQRKINRGAFRTSFCHTLRACAHEGEDYTHREHAEPVTKHSNASCFLFFHIRARCALYTRGNYPLTSRVYDEPAYKDRSWHICPNTSLRVDLDEDRVGTHPSCLQIPNPPRRDHLYTR